jgi:hypothetical protein
VGKMEKGIIGQGFEMSNEGLKAIQGVFELRKPISEVCKDILENSEWITVEGTEINVTPEFIDYSEGVERRSLTEILEEQFHEEGRHFALTASFLNKEGIE